MSYSHEKTMPQDGRYLSGDQRDRFNDATKDRLNRQEEHQSVKEYVGDAGITTKVKTAFLGQKGLDSLDIKVITVDGVVTLMGDVNNDSQIALAEKAAREVSGVKSVENKLLVKK